MTDKHKYVSRFLCPQLLYVTCVGMVIAAEDQSLCVANHFCLGLNLNGKCCPTEDHVMLHCCDDGANPPPPHQSAAPSPTNQLPPSSPTWPAPQPDAHWPFQLLGNGPVGSDKLPIRTAGPHPLKPGPLWGTNVRAPLPTNRWWQNFVLQDGGVAGGDVVSPLPYLVQASGNGLAVSHPLSNEWSISTDFVTVPFYSKLILGAKDLPPNRHVAAYDDLSVTLVWAAAAANNGSKMQVPMVRGMPYVSAFYSGLKPQVLFPAAVVKTVEGKQPPIALHGERFVVVLDNGQTWHVYLETPIDVHVEAGALRLCALYDGVLRVALAPEGSEELLDEHAAVVPVGGNVSAISNGDSVQMLFNWLVQGQGDLVMMALPHHLDVLKGARFAKQLSFTTLKGRMHAVIGSIWRMHEALPPLVWTASRPIAHDKVDAVRSALHADSNKPLEAVDPYGAGKELGALARLVLIADELDESQIASKIRQRLAGALEQWLSTLHTADPLLYEPTYGGVVSSNSLRDSMADFGNGYFNDHHFCYGYFLYAAAVVGKGNATWLSKWADAVLHLYRDIANPKADALYPAARHKDFFVGHSWASGLFASVSGRNQESSSESVNAYYGAALLGKVLGDVRLRDFGRLLLATEMRSAWWYWQVDSSVIYPKPFSDNMLATNVWSTKVDASTWFGSNVEYQFGIQIIPITPLTEKLLRHNWLKAARGRWKNAIETCSEQWRAFLLAADSLVDEEAASAAWNAAQKLSLFDNGNSKTNMLYFLSTRGPPPPPRPPTLPLLPSQQLIAPKTMSQQPAKILEPQEYHDVKLSVMAALLASAPFAGLLLVLSYVHSCVRRRRSHRTSSTADRSQVVEFEASDYTQLSNRGSA